MNRMQLQSILTRSQKYDSFVYEGVKWGEEEKGQSLNNNFFPLRRFEGLVAQGEGEEREPRCSGSPPPIGATVLSLEDA